MNKEVEEYFREKFRKNRYVTLIPIKEYDFKTKEEVDMWLEEYNNIWDKAFAKAFNDDKNY